MHVLHWIILTIPLIHHCLWPALYILTRKKTGYIKDPNVTFGSLNTLNLLPFHLVIFNFSEKIEKQTQCLGMLHFRQAISSETFLSIAIDIIVVNWNIWWWNKWCAIVMGGEMGVRLSVMYSPAVWPMYRYQQLLKATVYCALVTCKKFIEMICRWERYMRRSGTWITGEFFCDLCPMFRTPHCPTLGYYLFFSANIHSFFVIRIRDYLVFHPRRLILTISVLVSILH